MNEKGINIIVYRITGQQLFFRIPESVCEECDLTVATVKSVIDELKIAEQVNLRVKPWINSMISCLLWRSWHPPVVTVNGRRFSQGVVPDRDKLKGLLQELAKGGQNGKS